MKVALSFIFLCLAIATAFQDSKTYRAIIKSNNHKLVQQHNTRQDTYKMKLHSKFAEKSMQELQETYLTLKINLSNKLSVSAPPKSHTLLSNFQSGSLVVNWTKKGKVSPVTDQGWCGSCYAHTGVADIESSYRFRNKNITLSIQQIVDCSSNFQNYGCWGGWMGQVFDYVIVNGITTREAYPDKDISYFLAQRGSCDQKRGQYKIRKFAYTSYRIYDCQSLANIVRQRPVSVAVDANLAFIFYSNGTFTGCQPVSSISVNHAMLIVGFVQNATDNYWIARNSWGLQWGEYGYIRLDRNIEGGNQCQVCLAPHYSIL